MKNNNLRYDKKKFKTKKYVNKSEHVKSRLNNKPKITSNTEEEIEK